MDSQLRPSRSFYVGSRMQFLNTCDIFNYFRILSSIPDSVTAIEDAWFVGDTFMDEIFRALNELKRIACILKTNPPYLYQFFNVFSYYQNKLSCVRGIVRILNALIEGLNNRHRLPRLVVFIMDRDFISHINYFSFRVTEVMETVFHWLAREVNKLIRRRKADLFDIKPGAILLDQTKIVWVKMIKRPYMDPQFQKFDSTFALRNKFNNAIKTVLADLKPINYILNIKVDERDFYPTGGLTEQGQRSFWREIDECLSLFDQDKINLKLKALKETPLVSNYNNSKNQNLKKLPSPPPKRESSSKNRY